MSTETRGDVWKEAKPGHVCPLVSIYGQILCCQGTARSFEVIKLALTAQQTAATTMSNLIASLMTQRETQRNVPGRDVKAAAGSLADHHQ